MFGLKKTKAINDEVTEEICGDRRSKQRFPIEFPLTYKIVKNCLVIRTGTGTTSDISSSGIAFIADEPFNVGAYVELSITWPVLLNGSCPLKLVVEGRVVRSSLSSTAIRMDCHQFRTQGRPATQPVRALTMVSSG